MILTGKAKEDFEKWLNKEMYYLGRHNFEDRDNNIEDLSDNFQNALIIEWFDSVGIKILPYCSVNGWYCELKDFNNNFFGHYKSYLICKQDSKDFYSRQEATVQAIKKANEIYNSK